MLDSEVFLPVIGQALVERTVLLSGDVRGVARPDRLRLVELLVGGLLLLDLLRLLLLGLVLVLDFLDLGLLLIIRRLLLVVFNLLLNNSQFHAQQRPKTQDTCLLHLLGDRQLNWV